MSHGDYERSKMLSTEPFYSLLMAAMRRADTDNLNKLKAAFPDVWEELTRRYHAPGGFLTESEMLARNYRLDLENTKDVDLG